MKKVFTLLSLCLILGTIHLDAQYSGNKDALAVRYLFPNYRLQLSNNLNSSDFTAGVQVEYTRNISELFNLSIPFNLALGEYPSDDFGNSFIDRPYLGLDALLQFKLFDGDRAFNPSVYAGLGFNVENFDAFNGSAPLGLVLDIKLSEALYLSPKIEYRLGFSERRDNFMPGIGVKFLLGEGVKVADRDKDGVPDEQDLCPDQAGLAGLNGCPDRDGDGITDGDDACPDKAGTKAMNGCPDTDKDGIADNQDDCPNEFGPAENNGCPLQDRDGDGVTDDKDQCPDIPGLVALAGCPDTDSDGIPDNRDACPKVAGSVATNGCPDTDGDRVIDSEDQCPNTPGTVSNNGCPELSQKDKEVLAFAAQAVQFETASAVLKSISVPILDQVADIMRRYSSFRLSIDGHTDSIGSSLNNQSLSEKRAKSCYDYLISKGISPERMSYQGFGESKPVADNRTREGREENRRVEFNVIQ
jgi:outer membrane protein OmpA-like peptidoglycan-associated protein